jgi:chemotaxis methyl-accepting protein methylase
VSVLTHSRLAQSAVARISQSKFLRKHLGRPYVSINIWIWNRLPASMGAWRLVRAHGAHLHRLIQLKTTRRQYVGTFFFRNRPELELLARVLDQKSEGSSLGLTVLGCSNGAEVYSFAYTIRRARPDLKVSISGVDISKDVLDRASTGLYSLKSSNGAEESAPNPDGQGSDVPIDGNGAGSRFGDQPTGSSIFERMSAAEMDAMFDQEESQVRVKPKYREGIDWLLGDAGDPGLVATLGLQDIVIANRFLCHMPPAAAEQCLRQLVRLAKPGGYLFISGVDLDMRSKIARECGLRPLTDLIEEIYEGDSSLRDDWPLRYWGLEPFDQSRIDWKMRYASVFQRAE